MPQSSAHLTHQGLRYGAFPLAKYDACDTAHVALLRLVGRMQGEARVAPRSPRDSSRELPWPRRNRQSGVGLAKSARGNATSMLMPLSRADVST